MRIAEYKQIDTQIIENEMPILDDNGNITSYETIRKEVPIMGMVYRDMTEEEVAEMESVEMPIAEPTLEEKINALYQYMGLTINQNGIVVKEVYSADNPIRWVEGMTPINNAFYLKDDGKIYVYMDGNWILWEV